MTLTEVIGHIRRHDGCDEVDARRQMAHAIGDRKVWPEWDDQRALPRGSISLPILSDDDDQPTINVQFWLNPETDPDDPDRIREQRNFDPKIVKGRHAAKLEAMRRFRKPLFPVAHVLMTWPDASPGTRSPARPAAQARSAGGRPPKYDWDAFTGELIRLANTPDGLPGRTETVKHMKEWCAANWREEPADSMIRERIARLYPRSK